jgi:tRNA 2-thiocytidine biosynthesis protein TtcA
MRHMELTPTRAAKLDSRRADYESNKLVKRLCKNVAQAITDYNMIEDGDRVMVCLSGGKDSYGLLEVLLLLRERAPIRFDLIVFNLDQRHPGFPEHVLPEYLTRRGVPFHIEAQDTYSIVKRVIPEGRTMCGLCSRLRRGVIYRIAKALGATKIALGHHRDDILETLFLNMFYGSKLKAMPPKLVSDDGRHIVTRPLAYCEESDLEAFAELKQFPIIPCNLCGSQPNSQRHAVKQMMREWDKKFPGRLDNMFRALQNVVPSHLADAQLYPFAALESQDGPFTDGDIAFDPQPLVDAVGALDEQPGVAWSEAIQAIDAERAATPA